MTIRSEWGDAEHRIIITTYDGDWTWYEAYEHIATVVVKMLTSVNHQVAIIDNLRVTHWLSPNTFLPTIKQQLTLLETHPIMTRLFVLSEPQTAALLVNAYRQFDPQQRSYQAFDNLDDALNYVHNS